MADISAWSTTASDNDAAAPDGWPEGQPPSSVNDCAREMMAAIRRWFEDAQWINFGHVPTRIDNDTFTVPTDLTAIYHAGRRLKVDGSATGYCTIASSSFGGGATTVNVTMDSGNLPATLSTIYVSILSATNVAIPASLSFSGISLGDGTAGTPALNFTSDTNTGVFRSGADDVGISAGGTARFNVSSSAVTPTVPVRAADGDASAPGIAFSGDTNTGIYRIGADNIGISTGGTLRFDITSAGVVRASSRELGYRGLNGNAQNAGYTFVAGDAGRAVKANTAGSFTIDNSVFAADDIITFINTTGSNCTLTQGAGVTFRLMGASGTTGNRTVADFGVATIIAQTAAVFLVGGPGVS